MQKEEVILAVFSACLAMAMTMGFDAFVSETNRRSFEKGLDPANAIIKDISDRDSKGWFSLWWFHSLTYQNQSVCRKSLR